MPNQQVWNFGAIEGSAGEIHGAAKATQTLLDEGERSLALLAEVWGGTGSSAYQAVQMRWDANSKELNAALEDLGLKISEASQNMAATENAVTSLF